MIYYVPGTVLNPGEQNFLQDVGLKLRDYTPKEGKNWWIKYHSAVERKLIVIFISSYDWKRVPIGIVIICQVFDRFEFN